MGVRCCTAMWARGHRCRRRRSAAAAAVAAVAAAAAASAEGVSGRHRHRHLTRGAATTTAAAASDAKPDVAPLGYGDAVASLSAAGALPRPTAAGRMQRRCVLMPSPRARAKPERAWLRD